MKRVLVAILMTAMTTSVTPQAAAQDGCAMPEHFNDPHPVLHDGKKSVFWVRPLEVDADGARHAYHRDDPHGSKGLAIEYMGNGMTISRDGQALAFEPDETKNQEWLNAFRMIVDNGWKAPPGWSLDIYGIARDAAGRVCVGRDGRLVSPTSLVQVPQARPCEQRRYIDALKLPGIVVPNRADAEKPVRGGDQVVAPPFASRGVGRGDLAVVYNPATQIWKGAFIYDTGPRDLLGEGSVRLVLDLRGEHKLPTSGLETNSLGIEETYVVVFPGTAKTIGPGSSWTHAKIQALAEHQFKRWGGGSLDDALHKLQACATQYKTMFQ